MHVCTVTYRLVFFRVEVVRKVAVGLEISARPVSCYTAPHINIISTISTDVNTFWKFEKGVFVHLWHKTATFWVDNRKFVRYNCIYQSSIGIAENKS